MDTPADLGTTQPPVTVVSADLFSTPPPQATATSLERFQARTGAIEAHNKMIGTLEFLRGLETCKLVLHERLMRNQTAENAGPNAFRFEGASMVLDILVRLGQRAAEPQPYVDRDNLPRGRAQRTK